jgi:hypothetical protein
VGYVVAGDGSATVSLAAPGDTDLNGEVNVFDLVGIDGSGGYGSGAATEWFDGDFNYDGRTNVFDIVSIDTAGIYGGGNYLSDIPATAGITAVPEPVVWPLAAVAGLGCLAWRRARGLATDR